MKASGVVAVIEDAVYTYNSSALLLNPNPVVLLQSYVVALTAAPPHGNTITVPAGIDCPDFTVNEASPSAKSVKDIDEAEAISLSLM